MNKNNSKSTINDFSLDNSDYECCTNSGCISFQKEVNEKFEHYEKRLNNLESNNQQLYQSLLNQSDTLLSFGNQLSNLTDGVAKISSFADVSRDFEGKYEFKLEQLKDFMIKQVPPKPETVFVPLQNKLIKVSDTQSCCKDKCLTNGAKCKNGHGIVRISKDGLKVMYHSSTCDEDKDKPIMIEAEKEFSNFDIPTNVSKNAHIFRYFEAKLNVGDEKDFVMQIGLYKNENLFYRYGTDGIHYFANGTTKRISIEKSIDGTVFGFGQIFHARNKPNEEMQIILTLNGN